MNRIALIAAVLTSIPTVAAAEPQTATVIVTPADLASPAARAKLDRRIGAAIEQVCGSFASIESAQEPEVAACWSTAKNSVDQRLASLTTKSEIQLASK